MKLFLDIEKTIIESIDKPRFLEKECDWIEEQIKLFGVENVRFFSFDLWGEKDLETFDSVLRMICETLGIPFSKDLFVLKNDLFPAFKKVFPTFQFEDFSDLTSGPFAKEIAFQIFVTEMCESGEFHLIDDMVRDSLHIIGNHSIIFHDIKRKV